MAINADSNAVLFYNDYNLAVSSSKRTTMFNIIEDFGSLIDGVGAQMHTSYNAPSTNDIQALADGTVSRGLKLHFSELDIRTNLEQDANVTTLSSTKANLQQEKYKEVVRVYNSIPLDNKFAITVWGLRDNESWLLNFWGFPDWPFLFDKDYNRKKAYQGFLEGLK